MSTSSASIDIGASLSRVWEVVVDVESWPQWTVSINSAKRLDDGPLRVGSSARIEQPKLRPMVWTVSELVPEKSFTWAGRVPGLVITGKHTLTALDDGRVRLDLDAEGSGPLAFFADVLTGRRVRHYVSLEAAGMKAAAESKAESESSSPA